MRHARLGLCIGGAALAFASGFAVAKLRTEMVRAPVLAHELRYVTVAGFVEAHELRDKGRARIMLRVLASLVTFAPHHCAKYGGELQARENWLLADGDERDVAKATDESVFRCDTLGCIGLVKGKTVALIRHPGALEEDCRLADIVIAPFTIGKKCRAARVIVDRRMLKAQGAHALYIEGLSIRTETVSAARGRRPWAPDRAIVTARQAASPQWDDGGNRDGAGSGRRSDGNPED